MVFNILAHNRDDHSRQHGISSRTVAAMIEVTRTALSEWQMHAKHFGVSRDTQAEVSAGMAKVWHDFAA